MKETITRLNLGSREFVLVGTAHVSRDSVQEVQEVIESEQPDRVCVELDEGRYQSLNDPNTWQKLDIFQVLKQRKGFLLLANLALGAFQRRLGSELEVKPGSELLAAVVKAQEIGKPYSLIDREVQVTLRRAWAKSSLWQKAKLLSALIGSTFEEEQISSEEVENLKNRSELEGMMEGLAKELPRVKEVLIDERDQYLACKLFEAEGQKLVAVVGAGHVPGMVRWLEALDKGEKKNDVESISHIPPKSKWTSILPWLVPLSLIGLLAFTFVSNGVDKGLEMLLNWFFVNGGLSALGALICLAHPVTILTAFVAAPFTSLHPAVGVGMFTGMVEAYFNKPTVKDFENLTTDTNSLKGFFKNRITRILLVFILSSIGSIIGTLVMIPWLTKVLTTIPTP